MTPISEPEFTKFLEECGISLSPKNVGIGRQLSSEQHRLRIVNIHFQEDEPRENQKSVLEALFSLEPRWFIFPRYCSVAELLGATDLLSAYAANIDGSLFEQLIESMVILQENRKIIEFDPYFISSSGQILAFWDHHVFSEGFSVKFASLPPSSQFISVLNTLGAEFEVFASNA
ncbi:hypothetical protein [Geothrix alkalitolerans]|uniref:hypothetical protein n=1 Tax=Geothrix alkalitolerans TaxID=2922724 RepID=UPI001FAFE1A1|nr:hypothetical protein [Geothrix alkalitolerans]